MNREVHGINLPSLRDGNLRSRVPPSVPGRVSSRATQSPRSQDGKSRRSDFSLCLVGPKSLRTRLPPLDLVVSSEDTVTNPGQTIERKSLWERRGTEFSGPRVWMERRRVLSRREDQMSRHGGGVRRPMSFVVLSYGYTTPGRLLCTRSVG